jgi:hypothetical protein
MSTFHNRLCRTNATRVVVQPRDTAARLPFTLGSVDRAAMLCMTVPLSMTESNANAGPIVTARKTALIGACELFRLRPVLGHDSRQKWTSARRDYRSLYTMTQERLSVDWIGSCDAKYAPMAEGKSS